MEITPEIQAQLDEQKKQCIFCKIIKGEMDSKRVYEDDLLIGILDINPCTKGHILLMPKEHYPIMPYLPPKTFSHMFGLMPKMIEALKKAMLATGGNVFVANGGVAGQQSPHFLIHLFPREKGDGIYKYSLDSKKQLDVEKNNQVNSMLANNLPLMMKNHFSRNPAKWHTGNVKTADFLKEIKEKQLTVYEDEKVLCVVPENQQSMGHLVIYSNEEKELVENLSNESSAHLFFTASFCATAVFEGLGAHGSNIILKSGRSDDNQEGRLCVHVLPRFQDDGIDVMPVPMSNKPNLDEVASKVKSEMFMVEYSLKGEKKPKVIDLDSQVKVIKLGGEEEKPENEIQKAIRRIIERQG